MFVRDFVHVVQPFERVAPRFVTSTTWLVPIAEQAAAAARDVAVTLGGANRPEGEPLGSLRCQIGPLRARATSLLLPLWFVSDESTAALPDLAGDLEVAPVGTARSLLAFGATYRRPAQDLHEVERVARAAEVGVRTFLDGIAVVLAQPATAP